MTEATQALCDKLKQQIDDVVRSGADIDYNHVLTVVIWAMRDSAMAANDGVIAKAAVQLGLNRSTLSMALHGAGIFARPKTLGPDSSPSHTHTERNNHSEDIHQPQDTKSTGRSKAQELVAEMGRVLARAPSDKP
jgi:DNA-binding protein Fis